MNRILRAKILINEIKKATRYVKQLRLYQCDQKNRQLPKNVGDLGKLIVAKGFK